MKPPPAPPLVLVEDDAPFRGYLRSLLQADGRYRVVGSFGTAEEALAAWPVERPVLALLDLELPGMSGGVLAGRLLQRDPGLLVVMLTAHEEDSLLLASLHAGACGYLVKGCSSREVLSAVELALAGGAPMTPEIGRRVLHLLRQSPSAAPAVPPSPDRPGLTVREREVLTLVAEGLQDKEIATRLGTALSTVKNHLANIYTKWRVRSRTEAALRMRRG